VLQNREALYIAIGIIGATVMPHNLYLHSALVQTRKIQKDGIQIRRALRLNFWDSTIALNLAFLVNAAILVLAAAVFFKSGKTGVASIREAFHLLSPLLGSSLASTLFAIALIAAGQSSTLTGTLAGQIVMEGHLRLRINPILRRLITRLAAIVPAILVIALAGEDQVDRLLVFSQVVLSLQLGFAVIPLIHFVSSKKDMGEFSISVVTRFFGWAVAALLVYLNLKLVLEESSSYFTGNSNPVWKILILAGGLGAMALLVYVFIYPWVQRQPTKKDVLVHGQTDGLKPIEIPHFKTIAVALDFSRNDPKLLAYALGQGGANSLYILIHVVESASARILGTDSDDYETRNDEQRLNLYRSDLEKNNYRAVTRLGYEHRSREIVRIVKEENADMLVVGAHGHSGLKDFIYGETVNSVRHELKIPVLIVSL
jgi:manganese transport protein